MKTGASQSSTGTPMRVMLVIVMPPGPASRSGARGPASAAPQSRVTDALRKAAQSSPGARAALRRNSAAVDRIAGRARNLASQSSRSPLAALKQGLGMSAGLRTIARDMRKDFGKDRHQGKDIEIQHTHALSERGHRHAAAAERGLRRGGLGLLSAAWHGMQIAGEQHETLSRERAEARAEARAAGKPVAPDGMRALLGSALKGVGIARGQHAPLSGMHAQTRGEHRTGGDAVERRAMLSIRAQSVGVHSVGVQSSGAESHGHADASITLRPQEQGRAPRVLHATGFALGVMAMHGGASQGRPQVALGLVPAPSTHAQDQETHAWP